MKKSRLQKFTMHWSERTKICHFRKTIAILKTKLKKFNCVDKNVIGKTT